MRPALFVQRMKTSNLTLFALDAEITIRQICLQLDCLPLTAIELAAARVDLFSLTALLAHLQNNLPDVLVDGAIDLCPPTYITQRNSEQLCTFGKRRKASLLWV